ncbi:unnamed protein product [Onchocerca flexuosa]|uniref:Ovule protein n=1 Tax=Onchocerca flexuosa TaxID=387005 RepID=A0A183H8Q2_9BILA|nr:unnamed protein product [Onchocerca flexuosa]
MKISETEAALANIRTPPVGCSKDHKSTNIKADRVISSSLSLHYIACSRNRSRRSSMVAAVMMILTIKQSASKVHRLYLALLIIDVYSCAVDDATAEYHHNLHHYIISSITSLLEFDHTDPSLVLSS